MLETYQPYFNAIVDCSRLFVLVCIVYLVIRKGKLKAQLHRWVIAANNLFLVASVIYMVLYIPAFIATYFHGDEYENYAFMNRISGPYWWAYWYLIANNILLPNLLWFKKIRQSAWILPLLVFPSFIEPIVIIITSFHRDYLPSSWAIFHPLQTDVITLLLYIALLTATYYIIQWHQNRKQPVTNQ
jgi:hypothetical protein